LSGRAKSKPASVARPRVKTVMKQVRMPVATTRGNLAVIEMVDTVIEVVQKPAEVVMIPLSRRISIMELREGLCKWPIGDPMDGNFAYCGADCTASKVYCEAHARIAFQPQNERRRSN
ncbi:MAG: GcrA family cell cycle regulator, partial [Rhabdaerophilum sp.]